MKILVLWTPRVLAILFALFLAMFALDAIGESAVAFAMHLLPALLVLGVVALAWKREWLGAVLFVCLAALYAVAMRERVYFAIVGPILLVAALFAVSWMSRPKFAS